MISSTRTSFIPLRKSTRYGPVWTQSAIVEQQMKPIEFPTLRFVARRRQYYLEHRYKQPYGGSVFKSRWRSAFRGLQRQFATYFGKDEVVLVYRDQEAANQHQKRVQLTGEQVFPHLVVFGADRVRLILVRRVD
ncbi:hypothetical protein F442_07858 [Phytophthora nicotianae P10297]|uniref:Uncharacterized protein n=1 Tax=Phytophthora nicotianae P10297 TaxID=1317064 RepID=W2ZEN8_PHYNI|nr:hypothetical protein F442_07858 [Phytophthora nicotianae P10297]